jgi:hypothetical protein
MKFQRNLSGLDRLQPRRDRLKPCRAGLKFSNQTKGEPYERKHG